MPRKKRNNILIVGAGGFVGRALLPHIIRAHPQSTIYVVSRGRLDVPPGIKTYRGDLTDDRFCRRILRNVDTVFYLAAFKKNISVHTTLPFTTVRENVSPLLIFLSAARQSSVREIIYTSSVLVGYLSSKEETLDGYVWGKHMCELALRSFASEMRILVRIVRSAPLYGPGDNFDPRTANMIPSIIVRAMSAENELEVWGSGKRKIQLMYIDDFIRNLLRVSRSRETLFVFGDPRAVSINQIVKNIITYTGKDLSLRHDLTKPDKVTQLFLFKNIVTPRVSLASGLEKTVHFYMTHYG